MKKIVMIFCLMVCMASLSAQPTATFSIGSTDPTGLLPGDMVYMPVYCDYIDGLISVAQFFIGYDHSVLSWTGEVQNIFGDPTDWTFIDNGIGFVANWEDPENPIPPGQMLFEVIFIYYGGETSLSWGIGTECYYENFEQYVLTLINGCICDLPEVTFHITSGGYDIEGALVNVDDETITTNSSGIAIFNLQDGDYTYTVTKEGYTEEEGTFTVAGEPLLVEVEMGICYSEITFFANCCGEPLGGILITIGTFTILTNSTGMVILNLPAGTYSYIASSSTAGNIEGTVTIPPPAFIDLDFCGEVTFHVTTEQGYPLENVLIEVDGSSLVTDFTGEADTCLQVGSYNYSASKPGFITQTGTIEMDTIPQTVEIVMPEETWQVTVHILYMGGTPPDSALVTLGDSSIWVYNNNAHFYVESGSYSVSVFAEGYYPYGGGEVTVYNANVVMTVTLYPILYGVTLFVNCCGEPLEGIMLTIGTTTVVTGANGLAILNLEEGDYTVEINGYIFNFSVPETSYVDADICSEVLFSVSSGGEPVEEASITINNESIVTNALGIAEYCASPGVYPYSIEKVGYLPKSGSVTVTTEPAIIEEHLECEVTFNVLCNGPVAGVTIICGQNVVVTGPDGSANMSLEDGEYVYSFSHPDWGTWEGTIFVNGSSLIENIYCEDTPELGQKVLTLYPNPTSGKFSIENINHTGEPTKIFVTDITGRVVFQTVTSNIDKAEIDLTDQPKGMYFVRVKAGEMVVNRKVVIQ